MGLRELKGLTISFEDEGDGCITVETEDSIFIESGFFTGWMAKIEFWDLWGVPGE